MVSALKVGGRRLHDVARQGIEIERARDQEDGWRRFVASRPSIVLAELTASGEDGRGVERASLATSELWRIIGAASDALACAP